MRDCSARMQSVQAPIIPIIGEWIRRNPGTISLGQGVVYYPPPPAARDAIRKFFRDPDNHRYGDVSGLPELTAALKRKLEVENGIHTGSDGRLVITAGANMGFLHALFAITDPGNEVILLKPYYFNHEMAVGMLNCRAVTVPTGADYQPRLDAILRAITPRTRALVTVSPNNPSGAVYPRRLLEAINRLCRERGIYHISDEAYEYFTYDGAEHFSPGSLRHAAGHTISLFSLSKAYGFASWRIGYMVIPAHLFTAIQKAQDTNLICPPLIAQHAALGALKAGADYCRRRIRTIARVRKRLLEVFADLEPYCRIPTAQGAFYCLIRIESGRDAMALARRLIEEYRVAVIPGNTFGMDRGCYLRVSYGALAGDVAVEGLSRLRRGLGAIIGAGNCQPGRR